MATADGKATIIIDNGTGSCKAGLATASRPTAIFAAQLGQPRRVWKPTLDKAVYCGDEIDVHRSKLEVRQPMENGIVEDFEAMEQLWSYTFGRLSVNPARHPVLLTEPPYNPKPHRERMVEIMFEKFGVASINISVQGVLALLGQGRTTGLVLDVGEGVSATMPIFDGFGMLHCINRLDIAGGELNTLLAKLLAQDGIRLTTTVDQHHVRLMKEKHCYCAMDPISEEAENVTYALPDGREVVLGDERWRCPEALFNPSLVGLESMGCAGMVWDSINRCEVDLKKPLLSSVVLSGGSTLLPGFAARLTRELKNDAPIAMQEHIKILQSKDPVSAAWCGAQAFASLRETSSQEEQWMSNEDYDEYGAALVHDKIAVRYS